MFRVKHRQWQSTMFYTDHYGCLTQTTECVGIKSLRTYDIFVGVFSCDSNGKTGGVTSIPSTDQSVIKGASQRTKHRTIHGGSHPTQPVELDEDNCFKFLLSYVKSPEECWVHPVQVSTIERFCNHFIKIQTCVWV